jgi:hypothetical protein
VVVSVLATGSKGCGFKTGQGDVFLRAIKFHSTPSSRMVSGKAPCRNILWNVPQGRIDKISISCRPSGSQVRS